MATVQLDSTQIFIAGTLWAALWAGLGWFANHKLSTLRDRTARKHALEDAKTDRRRDFLSFMSGFRSWVERCPHELGTEFGNRVHGIRQETAKVRNDLTEDKRARFDEAVTALCRLSNSEVSEYTFTESNKVNHTGQDRVCTAIDCLVETVG